MARIQINYPGMGNSAMDLYIPQYGDSAIHNGMTEEMFYSRKFPVLWLLHAEGEMEAVGFDIVCWKNMPRS